MNPTHVTCRSRLESAEASAAPAYGAVCKEKLRGSILSGLHQCDLPTAHNTVATTGVFM
jgi:hypothetical protein